MFISSSKDKLFPHAQRNFNPAADQIAIKMHVISYIADQTFLLEN